MARWSHKEIARRYEVPEDIVRRIYAADELDVAADLFEEGGAGVTAGTLRERARLARRGDYKLLETYE